MSEPLRDLIPIVQIARLWAGENKTPGVNIAQIADDLVRAALDGEFEFPPKDKSEKKPFPYSSSDPPSNYDPRLGLLIETFTWEKSVVNSTQMRMYYQTRHGSPRVDDRKTRRVLARDIMISVEGFRRWCDRLGFAEWARRRKLSRPRFLYDQEVVARVTETYEPSKPKIGRGPGRKKGVGSYALRDAPLLNEIMELMSSGDMSMWAAAMIVAEKADGGGTLESKARRLVRRLQDRNHQ